MTDIFDVIADSTRRDILLLLLTQAGKANPEMSVSDLVTSTSLTQPTVSKQLKVLRDAGLVSVREEGQHRFYRLDSTPLGDIARWAQSFLGEQASPRRPEKASTGTSVLGDDVRTAAVNVGAAAATAVIRVREAWGDLVEQAKDASDKVATQARRGSTN